MSNNAPSPRRGMVPRRTSRGHFEMSEEAVHAKIAQIKQDLDRLEKTLSFEIGARNEAQQEVQEMNKKYQEECRKRQKVEDYMTKMLSVMKCNTTKIAGIVDECKSSEEPFCHCEPAKEKERKEMTYRIRSPRHSS